MTLPVRRVPFALDPLIAEAKRRARQRRILLVLPLVIAAAAIAAFVWRSSGGGPSADRRARQVSITFAVKSVNASTRLTGTYVTIESPVKLSRHALSVTPLFDVTGQFSLVKKAHGPTICSFTEKIERSVTFPNANGKTMRIEVHGSKPPGRVDNVCNAFKTFSLSYLRQPAFAGPGRGLHGIGAARHPRTRADRLDPSIPASIGVVRLKPRSSRLLRRFPNGERVFAVAGTTGAACAVVEGLRIPHASNLKQPASDLACSRLSRSVPTTIASINANAGSPTFSFGIALDGVTAVSWSAAKHGVVTVPVRHNAWVHLGNASFRNVTVHFAGGRTRKIHS
jgi:hypothetical protein